MKIAAMIPVAQIIMVKIPAMIITTAPDMMLLAVTKEKLVSTAMPQLPIPIRIQPRI